MTNTAIYDVERPDGKKIIDIVEFNVADEEPEDEEEPNDENGEDAVNENVSLSLSISKTLVPAGGGETTQVTVYVTHDNIPAEGAPVSFLAFEEQGGNNRNQQLSLSETVTDSDGKATAVYTTLAEDDNKNILIMANTRDDENTNGWQNSNNVYVVAAANASMVEGYVVNPFTGEAYPNADIGFFNKQTKQYTSFGGATDGDGYYYVPVFPGEYYIDIKLDMGDETYYTGSYTGSHHDFKDDNTVVLRENDFVIEGSKSYTLETEMGVIKGVVNNLGSYRKIYITRSGSATDTVIANVNDDGSFILPRPEGSYTIDAQGGYTLKSNVTVEKGKVTDLGIFSR
jgi:hypothetical protein